MSRNWKKMLLSRFHLLVFFPFFSAPLLCLCFLKHNIKSVLLCKVLTVGIFFFPDSIHSSIRFNPQKQTSIFTVEPLRILVVPWRKAIASAVFSWGGKCCDFSRSHLLLFAQILANVLFSSLEALGLH